MWSGLGTASVQKLNSLLGEWRELREVLDEAPASLFTVGELRFLSRALDDSTTCSQDLAMATLRQYAKRVKPAELTLGDFVKYLLALLQRDMVPLKLEDERLWHELFFALKRSSEGHSGKPRSLSDLKFDWDGPYPKSQTLLRFIDGLSITGSVTCSSPGFTEHKIAAGLDKVWLASMEVLPANVRQFLNIALVMATERFQ